MQRISLQSLLTEKYEIPLILNNEIQYILTTEFSSMDYNKVFNDYPDKEYPIMLENGMPIIHNQEPLRDYSHKETLEYNNQMALYRMGSLVKLTVKNSDIQEKSIDEIVNILKDLSFTVYEELENKVNEIIRLKFNRLQEDRRFMARKVLAFTDVEKKQSDDYKKEISKKRQDLYDEIDKITLLIKDCKYDNQIKDYYKQIKELEKQVYDCERILNINQKDGVKTSNGVTMEFVLLSLSEKYSWIDKDFLLRALKNDLSHDEEILLDLAKAKQELDGEESERQYAKINKKNTSKESN